MYDLSGDDSDKFGTWHKIRSGLARDRIAIFEAMAD